MALLDGLNLLLKVLEAATKFLPGFVVAAEPKLTPRLSHRGRHRMLGDTAIVIRLLWNRYFVIFWISRDTPGTSRNCLFLALDDRSLLQTAGLLHLWGQGWVEPVSPPPEPRHIIAQQILALCLQQHQVGDQVWHEWWNGLEPFTRGSADVVLRYLAEQGYLERDGEMLFIGARGGAEVRPAAFHGHDRGVHRGARVHRAFRPYRTWPC